METIIFDVDDTVYDQTMPFKNAFRKLFQGHYSDEDLEKIYLVSRKYSDALFERQQAGEISLLEMHICRISAACRDFGIPITYKKAVEFQQTYVAEQQNITLYDEVKELLELLHNENKQLAVLTNGEEDHQAMKISQLGLTKWIPEENIFISGSIGHAKPAPEVFQFIEKELQLNKNETVYIGDSFGPDIVGAKQAGWKAIWTNHRRRDMPEAAVKPDEIVYDAEELLALFQKELQTSYT